ncbi:MAG: FtsX-like permease family protein [Sphaerochaetaceae bacterium]|jgi:putative ABC transport system permease protein|nr:FtsX-like permease family protein [Sphaerochaetaceae bacterium]
MNFSTAKLAYRNLKLHKSKTLIIGVLITLNVAILVIGSSILNTLNTGIEENYVNKYTGSIFISPTDNAEPSLIMPSFDSDGANAVIDNYSQVEEAVIKINGVSDTTGQINAAGLMTIGENGTGFGIFRGIDPSDYQQIFPEGLNITDGSFLKSGEEGIVLSQYVYDMLNSTTTEEIKVGDKILLTSINETSGTKVREVTIRGIHQYDDDSIDISLICFIDLENIRALNGILLNTETSLNLDDNEKANLGAFDEEALFSSESDSLFSDDNLFSDSSDSLFTTDTEDTLDISTDDIYNILGDTSQRDVLNTINEDAFSYMLIKTEDSANTKSVINNLNTMFEENGWDLIAYEWTKGAGMSAQLADVISIVFYGILALIAIVVVIVIMNTLVVSISERTNEIGTMRALGAKKNYIKNMISLETIFITIVFGIIGIILGVSILGITGQIGIQATGTFTKILLGGDVFIPRISGSSILLSIISITIVSVVSSLYPVSVALRISPREAMSK